MFYQFEIKRADVRLLRKEILLTIARHNGHGVSLDKLAEEIHCGKRTVQNHVKALRDSGHIITTNNKPLSYTITPVGEQVVYGRIK